jgi:hypothetical protein
MVVGLLIQLGVIVINGLVVYNWRWLRAGHIISSSGYPLWVAGTFSMTFGISLCAEVIRKSTSLYTLGPLPSDVPLNPSSLQLEAPSKKATIPPDLQNEPSFRVFKIQEAITASSILATSYCKAKATRQSMFQGAYGLRHLGAKLTERCQESCYYWLVLEQLCL